VACILDALCLGSCTDKYAPNGESWAETRTHNSNRPAVTFSAILIRATFRMSTENRDRLGVSSIRLSETRLQRETDSRAYYPGILPPKSQKAGTLRPRTPDSIAGSAYFWVRVLDSVLCGEFVSDVPQISGKTFPNLHANLGRHIAVKCFGNAACYTGQSIAITS
jgi:hypothetical protein